MAKIVVEQQDQRVIIVTEDGSRFEVVSQQPNNIVVSCVTSLGSTMGIVPLSSVCVRIK